MKSRGITLLLVCGLAVCACRSQPDNSGPGLPDGKSGPDSAEVKPPSPDTDCPVEFPGLDNVVAFGPALLSGSVPHGDKGFDSLKSLGVQTIISVDGGVPDVDKATARKMRYIHLPIGYGGIDSTRIMELAKAVQVARRPTPSAPVYIHCHHGKHRSAAAAGAVAVTLGQLTPEEAASRMKVSGTDANYEGLYKSVAEARPAGSDELEEIKEDFPSVWKPTGLVKSMVEIDERFDHLTAIEEAGWAVPKDHPDLVPVAEAGKLAEVLRGLLDDADVKAKPTEFHTLLIAASNRAAAMKNALIRTPSSHATLARRLTAIRNSCKECHDKYRN